MEITGKGRGVVVATNPINKGEFVCEYIGEQISFNEYAEREKKYLKLRRKYKGYMFIFKFKEKKLW